MKSKKFWTTRRLRLLYQITTSTYRHTMYRLLHHYGILTKDDERFWLLQPTDSIYSVGRMTYSDSEYSDVARVIDELANLVAEYTAQCDDTYNHNLVIWAVDKARFYHDEYRAAWEDHNYDPDQLPFEVIVADTFAVVAEGMNPTGQKDTYYDKLAQWAAQQ